MVNVHCPLLKAPWTMATLKMCLRYAYWSDLIPYHMTKFLIGPIESVCR